MGSAASAPEAVQQFMILQISPDGQAVVGGPQLDLPVDKLMTWPLAR